MPIATYNFDPFLNVFERASATPSLKKREKSEIQVSPLVYQAKRKSPGSDEDVVSPPIDVFETPEHYEVVATIAGVSPSDVDIDFDPETNQLKLSGTVSAEHDENYRRKFIKVGERKVGNLERTVTFPEDVTISLDDIKAHSLHGVLKVILPKKQTPEKKKKITITITDSEDN